MIDLRLGRWQDVLSDVQCDALIVDAPYSELTHASHSPRTDVLTACDRDAKWAAKGGKRATIDYAAWTDDDVADFCEAWHPRVRGWFVTITDHNLAPVWSDRLEALGRYVFAPLPFVETGSRVRLAGDGPSSWTCWVVVARPRNAAFHKWGTLTGAYVDASERKAVTGGKPLGLMRAIARDYSRQGDLICDPCAGSGTTLLAAAMENRKAVGAEMDPNHYEIARKRIAKGYTPSLFTEAQATSEQLALDVSDE
jgi:site-specific DNA-methyltransferase (adenine-specific)